MLTIPTFDHEFQTSFDGPLSARAIARITAVQSASKLTINEIGAKLGLSGSFLGNLIRGYVYKGRVTAIRTKHIPRIEAALQGLEATYGLNQGRTDDNPAFDIGQTAVPKMHGTLEAHVRAIHDLGFAVTLTPLAASLR